MSTYTDLHNRLKENLTILRFPGNKEKDGLCPQRVILVNPENQFYGTFNGQMNISGGTLSGLKIVGGKIEGADVTDANFNGVSLQELTSNVSKLDQDLQTLDSEVKDLSGSYGQFSADVVHTLTSIDGSVGEKIAEAIGQLTGGIDGTAKDLKALCGQVDSISTDLYGLSSNVADAVVYRGTLALDRKIYTKPYEVLQAAYGGRCCLIDEIQQGDLYPNGWMWRVAFNRVAELSDPNILEVEVRDVQTPSKMFLGEGDFIILRNPHKRQTVLSDITLYDLNVINAQDRDVVKLQTLANVSSDLTSWTAAQIEYANKHNAEIENLSVTQALEAFGPTTISNSLFVDDDYTADSGTKVQISEDGIVAKTHAGIELEADDDIVAKAHGKIEFEADDDIIIKNTETISVVGNWLDITTERGLDSLSVNGKSLQSSLNEKFDVSSASEMSDQLTALISGEIDALQNEIDNLSNLSGLSNLSNYYLKTETSSAEELSDAFSEVNATISDYAKASDLSNYALLSDVSGIINPSLSDYLPLSGGTMKGDIELGGNASNFENSHAITFENGKILLADACGAGPGLGFIYDDGQDRAEGRYLFNDMGAESQYVPIEDENNEVVRSKDVYAALSNYAQLSGVPTIEVSSIHGQSEPGTTKIASISVNGQETGIYVKESQGDNQLRQDILNALSGLPNVNQLDVDSGISQIKDTALSLHMILSSLYNALKNE